MDFRVISGVQITHLINLIIKSPIPKIGALIAIKGILLSFHTLFTFKTLVIAYKIIDTFIGQFYISRKFFKVRFIGVKKSIFYSKKIPTLIISVITSSKSITRTLSMIRFAATATFIVASLVTFDLASIMTACGTSLSYRGVT